MLYWGSCLHWKKYEHFRYNHHHCRACRPYKTGCVTLNRQVVAVREAARQCRTCWATRSRCTDWKISACAERAFAPCDMEAERSRTLWWQFYEMQSVATPRAEKTRQTAVLTKSAVGTERLRWPTTCATASSEGWAYDQGPWQPLPPDSISKARSCSLSPTSACTSP